MENKLKKDLLTKFANHLLESKDVDEPMNYAVWLTIEELPQVFPKDWSAMLGYPKLCKYIGDNNYKDKALSQFFGITSDELESLFLCYTPREWSSTEIREDSTKRDIAQGIIDFINYKEHE